MDYLVILADEKNKYLLDIDSAGIKPLEVANQFSNRISRWYGGRICRQQKQYFLCGVSKNRPFQSLNILGSLFRDNNQPI
jgi:hypothetical protein